MSRKQTIAVYVPKWLYGPDEGITMFVQGLYRSIQESGRYDLLKITPRMCGFASVEEAQAFVQKHDIALVVYHDSRILPRHRKYEQGLRYLEACVPFINPEAAHVADDKIATKELLRKAGIPVLPDVQVTKSAELAGAMTDGSLYVAKLHDGESGRGVKLIRKNGAGLSEYVDRSWQKINARDGKKGLVLYRPVDAYAYALIGLLVAACAMVPFPHLRGAAQVMACILGGALVIHGEKILSRYCRYRPLMLEPFFGDGTEEFYCLRCTVLDGKVIEAAKKANTRNVTPNISHGGIATKASLTKEQEALAIAATKALGAVFSGVDLLCAKGQTVVCEVNVGPIGVYCKETGVDVGALLGEYAMQRADERDGRQGS